MQRLAPNVSRVLWLPASECFPPWCFWLWPSTVTEWFKLRKTNGTCKQSLLVTTLCTSLSQTTRSTTSSRLWTTTGSEKTRLSDTGWNLPWSLKSKLDLPRSVKNKVWKLQIWTLLSKTRSCYSNLRNAGWRQNGKTGHRLTRSTGKWQNWFKMTSKTDWLPQLVLLLLLSQKRLTTGLMTWATSTSSKNIHALNQLQNLQTSFGNTETLQLVTEQLGL